jgi:hypothetical protein
VLDPVKTDAAERQFRDDDLDLVRRKERERGAQGVRRALGGGGLT